MNEIWKPIKGYEGHYEVSNFGNVKSVERTVKMGRGGLHVIKERFLKQVVGIKNGYYKVCLSINGKSKNKDVHKLVAEAFLNHTPNGYNLVVNHIDFNRLNNNASNLEIVTVRENNNQKHLKHKMSSKYTGVSFDKKSKKWRAYTTIKSKQKNLGFYDSEEQAAQAYEDYKKEHNLN